MLYYVVCKYWFDKKQRTYTIMVVIKVEADIISSITASQIGLVVILVINVCLDIQTAVNVLMFSSVMS